MLLLAASGSAYARTVLTPLQEAVQRTTGWSDTQLSLLQGPAIAVPMVLFAIPIGLLVDRYIRIRLLAIFVGLQLLGNLALAAVDSYQAAFVARGVVGVSVTAATTTLFSLLADLYPPVQRGRACMFIGLGQYGGLAAAFAAGGALLSYMGDWRLSLASLTAPLLLTLATLLMLREPVRQGCHAQQRSLRDIWDAMRALKESHAVLIGLVLIEVAINASLVWAAPALTRGFRLNPATAGAMLASALMASAIGGPLIGGLLADYAHLRGGPPRTLSMLGWFAATMVPTGLFAFALSPLAATIMLAMFFISSAATVAMGTALLLVMIPNELRGLVLATFSTASIMLGIGLAPPLVSSVAGLLSGSASLAVALAIVTVGTSATASAVFLLVGRSAAVPSE